MNIPSSLPTGERGLKLSMSYYDKILLPVAPYWGAWIEITIDDFVSDYVNVAPYWGAWIEITKQAGAIV